MPRPRQFPTDDALLSAGEACALVHVSRSRWDSYAKRFRALTRGRRVVHATPGGKGVVRWLRSAVVEHLHVELTYDRPDTPTDGGSEHATDDVENEVEGDDGGAA